MFYNPLTIPASEPLSIAWSGGIDSTFTLKWLLENTEHEIYAYFFAMKSPTIFEQTRINAELQACENLLPDLQAIRPFTFEVITADYPFASARVASLVSIVQQVNFRRDIYNIFIGLTNEEVNRVASTGNPNETVTGAQIAYQFSDDIASAWEKYTRTADQAYTQRGIPKLRKYTRMMLLPQNVLNTKLEYTKSLGLAMTQKTFTCANTQWLLSNSTPCGTCDRCIERTACINTLQAL